MGIYFTSTFIFKFIGGFGSNHLDEFILLFALKKGDLRSSSNDEKSLQI